MDQNGTPIAIGGTVAVAVAALLFSPLVSRPPSSKQSSRPAPTRPAVSATAARSSSVEGTFESLSRDDRGPWYALCQEFAGDRVPEAGKAPQQQMEEVERTTTDKEGSHKFDVRKPVEDDVKSCKGPSADFQFLIATVPDPIGSHLNVEFDRALESLLRAAAVRGYSFERYWLPWRPGPSDTATETGSATEVRTQERLRQEQPGLLVLRRVPDPALVDAGRKSSSASKQATGSRDQFLLIFLVGETPTAGLNRPAFLKSLRYIEQLTTQADPPAIAAEPQSAPMPSPASPQLDIRIVGPMFSDTLPSLSNAIADYSADPHRTSIPIFHVVNYGARSHDLIEGFRSSLPSGSSFTSLDLEVAQAQVEWVDYLCTLGYEISEMAVLAEDLSPHNNDILFGRMHLSGDFHRKLHCSAGNAMDVMSLSFPRDLSTIRNATESDDANPEPQQIAGVNIPSLGVALTLRQDETNEHDAPPDFGQAQSSARVDRALRAVVKALRNRRIQAVLVSATNPLDRIFLLDYLHLTVPDVRLAILGADDFMLARPQHIDLSGTIAITSLPLSETTVLVERPGNTDPPIRVALNFPSNASEGIFLAAANLLGPRPQFVTDTTADTCLDITIVGKTGFRPAIMNGKRRVYPCLQSKTDAGLTPSLTLVGGGDAPPQAAPATNPEQKQTSSGVLNSLIPLIWVVALTGLLIANAAHLALVCSSNNWLRLGSLPKVARLTLSVSGVREAQLFFLLVATEQVFLLEWIAATTTSALLPQATYYQLALFGAHVILLLCSGLLCGRLLFLVIARVGEKYSRGIRIGVFISLLFVVSTVISWWWLMWLDKVLTSPFLARQVALRTIYFFEGLSPVLPAFFVLLAFYVWSLNNLHRLWLVVTRVSLEIPTDNAASRELAEMIAELQASIRRGLDLQPSSLALMGLTVAACFMVRLPTALRGFEVAAFRHWLLGAFVLLLLIVVSAFYRSWNVWLQLKRVLHFLDATLVCHAFSHVPKDLSSTRIWSFGGARTSFIVQIRTAELLQRMIAKYPMVTAMAAAAGSEVAVHPVTTVSAGSPSPEPEDSPFPLLRQMAGILDSGGVLGRDPARKLSKLLNAKMSQTAFLFDPDAVPARKLGAGEKSTLELYVAYRFVAFFRYVMQQLRNKLTFVIYGYTCLVVAASVYPFQGRESLGTLMTFLFVLLLAGVAAMMVQMYRDPVLKRLEEPSSGLSGTFEIAMKLVGVAGVPLCAVLASQFPSFAEVLLNWLRPLLESSH